MYKKKDKGWSQHQDFIAFDLLCLELALIVGYFIIYRQFLPVRSHLGRSTAVALLFIDFVVMMLADIYHNVIRRGGYQEFLTTLKQTAYISLGLSVFLIMMQTSSADTRNIFFGTIPLYFVLSFAVRSFWKSHLRRKLHFQNGTGLLVVTTEARMHDVLTKMMDYNYDTYRVVGIVLLDRTKPLDGYYNDLMNIWRGKNKILDLNVVADQETLIPYLTHNWVDEVYYDLPIQGGIPVDLINQIMDMGITVHVALSEMNAIEARNKNVEWICGEMAITASLGYVSGRSLMLKRLMDIVGGLVGCAITILLTLILGPMIYFTDKGPIFFKQTRIGLNGRKFGMYKFRSMYMNADQIKKELMEKEGRGDELMFKMENDPRIIGSGPNPDGTWRKGLGGWIRDLSLDEFPQFFNVLKGEMSLVGTRPPTVDEWDHYEAWHRGRMSTKPGITGLWQVSGRSEIRDFSQVVQLDREYIENWSLLLDLKILFRTIAVVVQRKGAM